MTPVLRALILTAIIGVNVVVSFVNDNPGIRPVFFGDGFDHTTCADTPKDRGCN